MEFGLLQLAQNGPDALKLASLCKTSGRTTGSFYHHFEDQAAFIRAILNHWQKTNTQDVIESVDRLLQNDKKADKLNAVAMTMNQAVEIGIRALAQQNTSVARIVSQVDEQRINYLTQLYVERAGLERETAQSFAELEYAAFVGTQMIWKGASLEHGQKLSSLFDELVRKALQ